MPDVAATAERQIGIPASVVREVLERRRGNSSTIADPTALLSRYIDAAERVWEYVDTLAGTGMMPAPRPWRSSVSLRSSAVLPRRRRLRTAGAPGAERAGQRLRARHRRGERGRARTAHPRAAGGERRRRRRRHRPTFQPYGDIREFAGKMFQNGGRGIGDKGKDNGLLIVVAVQDRRVDVEVGYDARRVRHRRLRRRDHPRASSRREFRQGNYGAGLLAGATRIINRIAERTRRHTAGRAARRRSSSRRLSRHSVRHDPVLDPARHHLQSAAAVGAVAGTGAAGRGAAGTAASGRSAGGGFGGGFGGFGGGGGGWRGWRRRIRRLRRRPQRRRRRSGGW